jgi:hypothetical protein
MYYEVVRRTAQYGLDQSKESREKLNFWLAIWSLDVICESHEVMGSLDNHPQELEFSGFVINENDDGTEEILGFVKAVPAITLECGDVIWGIAATGLLLGIPENDIFPKAYIHKVQHDPFEIELMIGYAALYAEYAKKVARDSREIDILTFAEKLRKVFLHLCRIVDPQDALMALDAKLWKRYPNGYTPHDSINRMV